MSAGRRRPSGKLVVTGRPMAPGLAVGHALFHTEHDLDIPVRTLAASEVAGEVRRLDTAVRATRKALEEVEQQIASEVGTNDARIFSVQSLLLDDPTFRKGLRERIREQLVNAEVAVRDEALVWEQRLAGAAIGGDRDPSSDLRDVARQLLRQLAGKPSARVKGGEDRVILVTRELLPSDAAHVDRARLAGIVTGSGGAASHAAILARSLGIPAVTGVDVAALPARGGRWIVDGGVGQVIVNPTRADLAAAERRSADHLRFRAELMGQTHAEAETADGTPIEILLNVENFEELPREVLGAQHAIGLYRTEFLYMHRGSFPSEEEQLQHYVGALSRLGPREITFRTIDVGGDKPLPYLSMPSEPNPVLGWRGLRLSLEWPDMFYAQIRALLRASAHGRVRILLPMITMVEEFRRARDIVREVQADLRRRGVPHDADVPVGAMVEVPAAAMGARSLAEEADFLSIGTNDLSQYALAVDRNNARVADLYQPLHPGLLQIVHHAVSAADASGTPISLCGELAGDPQATVLLLGLGLRSLSMPPYHLPLVQRVVRAVRLDRARAVAGEALRLGSTTEVRRLLRRHTLELVPDLGAWLPESA